MTCIWCQFVHYRAPFAVLSKAGNFYVNFYCSHGFAQAVKYVYIRGGGGKKVRMTANHISAEHLLLSEGKQCKLEQDCIIL